MKHTVHFAAFDCFFGWARFTEAGYFGMDKNAVRGQ